MTIDSHKRLTPYFKADNEQLKQQLERIRYNKVIRIGEFNIASNTLYKKQ